LVRDRPEQLRKFLEIEMKSPFGGRSLLALVNQRRWLTWELWPKTAVSAPKCSFETLETAVSAPSKELEAAHRPDATTFFLSPLSYLPHQLPYLYSFSHVNKA
jgi:hypothetical protein